MYFFFPPCFLSLEAELRNGKKYVRRTGVLLADFREFWRTNADGFYEKIVHKRSISAKVLLRIFEEEKVWCLYTLRGSSLPPLLRQHPTTTYPITMASQVNESSHLLASTTGGGAGSVATNEGLRKMMFGFVLGVALTTVVLLGGGSSTAEVTPYLLDMDKLGIDHHGDGVNEMAGLRMKGGQEKLPLLTASAKHPALHYFGKASTEFAATLPPLVDPLMKDRDNSFLADLVSRYEPCCEKRVYTFLLMVVR